MRTEPGLLSAPCIEQATRLILSEGTSETSSLGTPQDIDIATNAAPDQVKEVFAGLPHYDVGARFGTIGIILEDGTKVEITTYRSETYTVGSRKPAVVLEASLLEDLGRRDFTINAIAMKADGALIDPYDRTISKERIAEELNKMLLCEKPSRCIETLEQLDLLTYVIPELEEQVGIHQTEPHHKDVFGHTLMVVDQTPRTLRLRLAGLLHDIAKPRTKSVVNGAVQLL